MDRCVSHDDGTHLGRWADSSRRVVSARISETVDHAHKHLNYGLEVAGAFLGVLLPALLHQEHHIRKGIQSSRNLGSLSFDMYQLEHITLLLVPKRFRPCRDLEAQDTETAVARADWSRCQWWRGASCANIMTERGIVFIGARSPRSRAATSRQFR